MSGDDVSNTTLARANKNFSYRARRRCTTNNKRHIYFRRSIECASMRLGNCSPASRCGRNGGSHAEARERVPRAALVLVLVLVLELIA
jgi:hypothetical protein